MTKPDRRLWAHGVLGALASAAYWLTWIASGSTLALYLAIVVQPSIAVLVVMVLAVQRRALALVLAATVPVFGPIAAVLSAITIGTSGIDLLHDPSARPAAILDAAIVARNLRGLPVCEALVAGDADAKSVALAKLTRRGAAEDITTLKWAQARARGDSAVEIALAFEELCARFDHEASEARAAIAATPSFETYRAAFDILRGGIAGGVVDGHLLARVADEAIRHHAAAIALAPMRSRELLVGRVHVALLAHRADEALSILEAAGIDVRADDELAVLFRDVAYATRRFDLIPEMTLGNH